MYKLVSPDVDVVRDRGMRKVSVELAGDDRYCVLQDRELVALDRSYGLQIC